MKSSKKRCRRRLRNEADLVVVIATAVGMLMAIATVAIGVLSLVYRI